jgi:hypothetical protein
MPTKVIYYQGTTETFLPPAVQRGALETVDSPRAKRRRPIRSEDPDVLPPVSTPVVTAAPNGWDVIDLPIANRRRLRGEESQFVVPGPSVPSGWDVSDPLPRRRKLPKTEDSGLTFQTFVAPTGWESVDVPTRRRKLTRAEESALIQLPAITPTGWDGSDPRPFKRPVKQRDEAQLIVPQFAIPTGWEVEQRQRPAKRRTTQPEDVMLFTPLVLDTFGWYVEQLQRRKRLATVNQQSDLPIIIAGAAWGWSVDDSRLVGKRRILKTDDALIQPAELPAVGWEVADAPRTVKRRRLVADDASLMFQIVSPAWGWEVEPVIARAKKRLRRTDDDLLFPIPAWQPLGLLVVGNWADVAIAEIDDGPQVILVCSTAIARIDSAAARLALNTAPIIAQIDNTAFYIRIDTHSLRIS